MNVTMKRFLLSACVSLLVVACSHDGARVVKIVEIEDCNKEIQSFSDSSFFSEIACIQTDENGNVYVLDRKRSQIVRLNKDLELISVVGQQGRGPQELGAGANFAIHNDTIFVGDVYKRSLLRFTLNGKWCGAVPMQDAFPYFKRFVITNERNVCFSWPQENGSSLREYNPMSGQYVKFGEYTDFGTANKNDMQNARSVFVRGDRYVVVPWSIPVVECYSRETHELLSKLDLSVVSPIREIYRNLLADRELQESPMGFYVVIADAYQKEDMLYVLLNPGEGESDEFKVGSVILEIDISDDEMAVNRKWSLPGADLSRIGISDDYIYGFVPQSSSIKRYPLPK